MLIQNGADIELAMKNEIMTLHTAAYNGNDIIKYFKQNKSN